MIPAIPCLGSRAMESFAPSLFAPIARGPGRIQSVELHFPLGLWREEQPGQQELLKDSSFSLSWLLTPQEEGGKRVRFGDLQN